MLYFFFDKKLILTSLQVHESIKSAAQTFEVEAKKCISQLSIVHTTLPSEISIVGTQFLQGEIFHELMSAFKAISDKALSYHYHRRYQFLWTSALQNCLFVEIFAMWMKERCLPTPEVLADLMNTSFEKIDTDENEFRFTGDEYLHAVISLVNELSRLAVNSVTTIASKSVKEPFTLPVEIDRFIKEIQAGFGLLNLKNDSLRKRYDGMKYDVKKVEEVVYDLSLRGFLL